MKRTVLFSLAILLLLSSCASPSIYVTDKGSSSTLDNSWIINYILPPRGIEPNKVYTFFCESIVQRPTTLTNTCADFGEAIYGIKWTIWDINGAKGSGKYSINECKPNCAVGIRREFVVSLTLDRVTFDGQRYFLNFLTIVPEGVGEINLYSIWDLSSFYREVPGMRN